MKLSDYLEHGASQGSRNDALFQAVLQAREQGWTDAQIRRDLGHRALSDGLKQREIDTTIQSAYRRDISPAPAAPKSRPRSEWKEGALDWDSVLPASTKSSIAQVPGKVLPPPFPSERDNWKKLDLAEYIDALFDDDEYVAYNTNSTEVDGTHKPSGRGVYNRKARDIKKNPPQLVDDAAGAWIRINPMDGKGISDSNCTAFRHVLVECDDLTPEAQWKRITELKLPCSAIVHSGGKSLHFIVKVDAKDITEYRERVDELYKILGEKEVPLDTQNRNPSRLSRLPGVTRGGNPQYLLGTNFGCANWGEWIQRIRAEKRGLPEIKSLRQARATRKPLSPVLIDGVLRRGHKLLLSGSSKCGKTWTLIQLGMAISAGKDWLGFQCMKGRVLYMNLEVEEPSFLQRCDWVEAALGYCDQDTFDHWPLRGYTAPLPVLRDQLLDQVTHGEYDAIIIDPIYKTLSGDENSAKDMADFCRNLDILADRLGASIIFASHFSKGAQGGRASIDRTSGSGVFGRDPDAIGTLTQLEDDGGMTGIELEWTLREFKTPDPVRLEFQFPIHVPNKNIPGQVAGKPTSKGNGAGHMSLASAVTFVSGGGTAAAPSDVAKHLGISVSTLKRRIGKDDSIVMENGLVTVVEDDDHDPVAETDS